MTTGTKEFYEIREQFEKDLKTGALPMYGHIVKREGKDAPKGWFYTDGLVNQLFHAYMLGYGHGRLNYM